MSDKNTEQMRTWSGEFGQNYTDRNPHTPEQLNELYTKMYGVTRTVMNDAFLSKMKRDIKILEVGANVGVQLQALREMGFENLYGIELQHYAVEEAKKHTSNINIIQGSGFDIPFRDGWFDLVYTSGVLIHINPNNIETIMGEVYRCSRELIWGFEYYADEHTDIPYRGHTNLMWKANFAGLYQKQFHDLKLVKEQKYPYVDSENVDNMYLLRKT